jgi:hypothetical protein
MSEQDQRLFLVVRKAVSLGLLPQEATQPYYLENVEKIRALIAVVDASRAPGPATAKTLRLLNLVVKHAGFRQAADNEPIEIRMDAASVWLTLADAKAFIAEHEPAKSEGRGV